MNPTEFSSADALIEAAAVPGAELFVFPVGGEVEAVIVVAFDRVVWELRTDNAVAWLHSLGLRPGRSFADVEAAVSYWSEWVPRLFRGIVLGVRSPDDLDSAPH